LIFNEKFLKIFDKKLGILGYYSYVYNVIKMIEGRFTKRIITYSDAVFEALEEVASDYSDWPEDQGFGSSDMTYVRKSFIDSMISLANLNGYYETKFAPYLKVVEYSEFEKEEYDLRREQGI